MLTHGFLVVVEADDDLVGAGRVGRAAQPQFTLPAAEHAEAEARLSVLKREVRRLVRHSR